MIIVVASGNRDKIREISRIMPSFEFISMKEAGFFDDIEENGKTFFDNALLKARAVAQGLNLPALSDDSGLSVKSLNGAPGVYSARYAGVDGNSKLNNEKLLREMADITDRRAKFVSSVVLYYPDGRILSGYGETEGEITHELKGSGGFGYDPLFYSYELKKTFGEAEEEEKNRISHRARALAELRGKLL